MDAPTPLALLLLADGRFPAGGHAHSAGVEAAVEDGRVRSTATLAEFARGRLWTVGLVDAALAAATVVTLGAVAADEDRSRALLALDREADARIVAPPLRAASRRLGRQLARGASRAWPSVVFAEVVDLHPDGPHQSIATGAAAVAAGIGPADVALLVAHHAVATPTQAAVKLLGLDPFEVAALAAALDAEVAEVVDAAVAAALGPVADLPSATGPIAEIAAVEHVARPIRMFAT